MMKVSQLTVQMIVMRRRIAMLMKATKMRLL